LESVLYQIFGKFSQRKIEFYGNVVIMTGYKKLRRFCV